MTERILITGVAGFIGSRVAARFLDEGYSVVGVDDLSGGRLENVPAGVDFIEGDLAEKSTLSIIPSGCTRILHLAGQSSGEISFDDPVADLEKNTISTLNLIHYGIDNAAERFLYASSMSVYGAVVGDKPVSELHPCRPLSCYGVGKLAAEDYLRVFCNDLPFVSLRMFNVYGPGQDMSNLRQGMVSIFLAQALAQGRIEVKGSSNRFRDFIFIDDVVDVWLKATFHPSAVGSTLNVGTGVKTTVGGLLQQVCDLVPGSSYFVRGATPGDQNGIFADTTLLRQKLQIDTFTPLDAGLCKFMTWAKSNLS